MKTILLSSIFAIFSLAIFAQNQSGSLKLKVTEKGNGLPVPFANVIVYDSLHNVVTGAQTNFDGDVDIRPIPVGTYDIQITYVGFQTIVIKKVVISAFKTTYIDEKDSKMTSSTVELSCIEVRNPNAIQKISVPFFNRSGPKTEASDGAINVRGGRGDQNYYYIDGIKVRGNSNIPPSTTREVSVITGGTSAQYGSQEEMVQQAPQALPGVLYSRDNGRYKAKEKSQDIVPKDRNVYEMRYEGYEQYVENEFELVTETALSTFSIDVDNGSYTNARRIIRSGYLPPLASVRMEEFINYFPYERIAREGDDKHPFIVKTELGLCPWNAEHQLLRVVMQADEVDASERKDNNLVFLIDVSGSMQSTDKLELVKRAFRLLTDQLGEKDRVSIVTYAGYSGIPLDGAKGNQKDEINRVIDNLYAGGGTNGSQGIITAYELAQKLFIKNGNNRVILATDGDFNIGIYDNDALIQLIEEMRKSGVFLTTLGFGSGNYMDERMEQLADHGNGSYMYVDSYEEARKVFLKELTSNLEVKAKDVKFQIEFNPKKVASYRLLGYENRVLADKDFDDDTKDAGELGAGETVTAFYEIVPVREDELSDSLLAQNRPKRYQTQVATAASNSEEMLYLKIRYKAPNEDESVLIEKPVVIELKQKDALSKDFQFGASVVEFALILRDSKYKGSASFSRILKESKDAINFDPEGYRREFIKLVEMSEEMYDLATSAD